VKIISQLRSENEFEEAGKTDNAKRNNWPGSSRQSLV